MGLQDIRSLLIPAIAAGRFKHEPRQDMATKNLLSTGEVSRTDVVNMLNACAEAGYTCTPHDQAPRLMVHEFRVTFQSKQWYLKFYLHPETGVRVYSVHE